VAGARKLVRIGGHSWGFVVTKDMLRVLGLDGEAEKLVVVETAGDSLVIRRAGAPAPTVSEVVRAAERVAATPAEPPPWRPALARLLAVMHKLGPSSPKLIAREMGRTREHTSASLKAAAAGGWVEKSIAGWELTLAAAAWFEERD
jgi:hypothetical protein